MAKLFSSGGSNPFVPLAQKTSEFVARVKQGMHEKETELQARYLGGTAPTNPPQRANSPMVNEPTPHMRPSAAPPRPSDAHQSETLQRRIERDRELGDDFFSSGVSPKL